MNAFDNLAAVHFADDIVLKFQAIVIVFWPLSIFWPLA